MALLLSLELVKWAPLKSLFVLFSNGAQADRESKRSKRRGSSSLFVAGHEGHARNVVEMRYCLRMGLMFVRETDKEIGCTPLYVATLNGHVDSARLLLEKDRECLMDEMGERANALYIACVRGILHHNMYIDMVSIADLFEYVIEPIDPENIWHASYKYQY